MPWEANSQGLQGKDAMKTSFIILDLAFFYTLIIMLVKLHRYINRYIHLHKEKTQPDSWLLLKMEKEPENAKIMVHLFNNDYRAPRVCQALF